MTTYDLMIKVKEILEANGYTTESAKAHNTRDYDYQAKATKDGKSWTEPYIKNYDYLFGYTIDFMVVYKSNAAKGDTSVDICIRKWERNNGKTIAKQRVNINMSDRSINNRVKKIMDAYEEL